MGIWYLKIKEEDLTFHILKKGLEKGIIPRADVTREEVLKRMPTRFKGLSESLYEEWDETTSYVEHAEKQRSARGEALKVGYYKEYEKTLKTIPINCEKAKKELVSKYKLTSENDKYSLIGIKKGYGGVDEYYEARNDLEVLGLFEDYVKEGIITDLDKLLEGVE